MIGRTVSHFQITAKIGEGGMGEVYRATDLKLGRDVALKVLPQEMASDPGRIERFQREARAVAALNHPHIVTIHSVEEADGVHFITMELVEGRSFEKLIPEQGLDPERFFDLAIPLAEAVAAAHERGITHRDLKPANIMITNEGRLKVLDFGLAKLQRLEGDPVLSQLPTEAKTREGMIVGTIPYMSPEQIEGRTADHRTDIFSLGIIFYEMATGKRPFEGKSSPALMSAILKDAPQSITAQRQDLPHRLERFINRCLAKGPDDRYPTTREALEELEASRAEEPSGITQYRSTSSESPQAKGFWVAVLPFKHRGTNPDVEALAEGLSEDITTGLSKFSYLYVVSHNSTSRYRDQAVDIRHVGKELGARYVMEGGIRHAGTKVRINVQLLDTLTGTHLWAETFNRSLETVDVFDVQDELTDRIVSTVADPFGVLARSMAAPTDGRQPETLTPYESVLRWFLYQHRVAPEDHLVTRTALEHAVELEPRYADAWACLAVLYLDEDRHEFNRLPDALDRALEAARRAVDADPANQLANYALAQAYYYRRDLGAFRSAAERAIELNLRDGNTVAMLGILIAYAGDWEKGVEITKGAMKLNPHHPGWYRFAEALDHYRKGDYSKSLESAQKINMPEYFASHLVLAAVHAQMGNADAARAAARELVRLYPDYEQRGQSEFLDKWYFAQPDLIQHIVEGNRKAGLEMASQRDAWVAQADARWSVSTSDEAEPKEKSIAVLPFVNRSGSPDEEYFSDGLSEEIIFALSRVPGLKVAARSSAFQFRGQEVDVREVGRKLGVATVLEGSVRVSGNQLRITTELVSSADGYQLWSERYNREMQDLFETQDEITRAIVVKLQVELVGDPNALAGHGTENLEAYRCYLRGRYLRHTKNDHAGALQSYKEAVRLDPTHAPSWLGVAEVTALAAFYGLIPTQQAYAEARKCLATAAKLQGEAGEAYYVQGLLTWFERQWAAWEIARLRALELEPNNIQALGSFGMLLCARERLDEAKVLFDRAREIDPLSAFPHASAGVGLLTCGQLQECRELFDKALAIEKENTLALWGSGVAHVAEGRFDNGIAALERAAEYSRRAAVILGILGWAHATVGQTEKARAILEEIRSRPEASPAVATEAWLLAALGRKDEAWEIVERAEEERQGMLYFLGLPPNSLFHGDPRWYALLRRFELPTPPEEAPSIAVLPFANMSADEENQYFSDGLSEEIINALTQLPGLRVIARTSAFRFRGEQDLRKVGEALGVRTLLEGSVRKSDKRLRITAQLIDVADDSHIWSERFDRELNDVFAIQDEISAAIAEKLHLSLGTSKPAKRDSVNVAAFEALLEGRHYFSQFTPKAAERALACLQRSLSLEPDYPDALVLHAFYHVMMGYMFADPREVLPPAKALAERALKRDPHYGEAHSAVAIATIWMDRDWPAAERHFLRALELAPASARAHELYGLLSLLGSGRLAESLAELDRAVELDPLSALYAGNRGRVLTCLRRFAEAEESCRRGLALDPGQLLVQVELIYALTFQQRFEEAVAIGRRAIETHGPTKSPLNAMALSLALAGEQDEARQLLKKAAGSGAYRSPLTVGLVHAVSTEMDPAFDYLQRAIDEHEPLLWYLKVHPMFDALRSDPRFPDLLRRMNLLEGGHQ